ncbi:MAG: preprotein translocase subunit YajC [Planctomycetota bacterium]|jgi:preprotein translocase subunit YajC
MAVLWLGWILQAEGEEAPGGGSLLGSMLPALLMMGLIFYFLVFRPQMKREKERKSLLRELKKNDKVVTQSGVLGTVVQLKEPWVVLRIDDNKDVRIRVLLNAVSGLAPGADKPEDKKGEG